MILDNEDQRNFLLAVIQNAQVPGGAIDLAFSTRQAVLTAPIAVPNQKDPNMKPNETGSGGGVPEKPPRKETTKPTRKPTK